MNVWWLPIFVAIIFAFLIGKEGTNEWYGFALIIAGLATSYILWRASRE